MGPALVSFQRGETQYSLRAFPIGGYCAMEGEDEENDNPRSFSNKSPWRKLIILAAGSVMNFIAGFVPVSYTHLDVYKRQAWWWGWSSPSCTGWSSTLLPR